MKIDLKRAFSSRIGALIFNLILALMVLFVARIIFVWYNYDKYSEYMNWDLLWGMFRGGLLFDLSTLFYINGLYIILYLFPLQWKEQKVYHIVIKYIYVVFNTLALFANLCDSVYFRFTARRTTATVFQEFANEDNILKIFGEEMLHSWWLVMLFAAAICGLIKLYRTPDFKQKVYGWRYYTTCVSTLVIISVLAIGAIRGGFTRTTRPITLSNANEYVNRPVEAAAVLNTPFSILRTIGKTSFDIKPYMSESEALKYYSPLHKPESTKPFQKKNVVIFILESYSRSFIGALNRDLDGGNYKGYTPFTDSLINQSLTYTNSFANGMKSIDAMPSILSSIPMMIEPFFVTPASMNNLTSIAGLLKVKGYHSAFFHGAPNGSMGFEAFAKASGFDAYYGMDEYNARHKGNKDFDGSWAIWDYPFFQYYLEEINTFKQPFVTALFSATSHHPFAVPNELKGKFPEEGNYPILKCIRYTDSALQAFFEKAKNEPWFKNTIFILVSDHSSAMTDYAKFKSDQGVYAAPIIFYDPSNASLRGYDTQTVAQQIDIMPTILNYLGYDKPYIAFGVDLFGQQRKEAFAFNYLSGIFQYTKGDYFMQFDGNSVKALYNFRNDSELKHNILSTTPRNITYPMEMELKSFIQQYCSRMRNNQLIAK